MTALSTRRGVALIVALGVLLLIALLATSFATLQSIERKVTHNYTDEVRAKLVAQSGVERAIDGLQQFSAEGWYPTWLGTDPFHRSWQYFGLEPDESREFELHTIPGEFSKLQAPLAKAVNPSFAVEADNDPANADSTPAKIRVEGRDIGFSGTVGGTYASQGDLYTLKVLDCQAQININDGTSWGNMHSVSQNLRRILNVLGRQPEVRVDNLGDKIVDHRPPGGYTAKAELQRILGRDYERVRDLVTVHSRSNPHVVNPVPLSEVEYRPEIYPIHPNNPRLSGHGYFRPVDANGQKIFRYGHGRDLSGNLIDRPNRPWPLAFWEASRDPAIADIRFSRPASFYHAVWTRDSLNPQWIETVERSPINVNTASRPVLMALVSGLEGFFELPRRRPAPFSMFYPWMWHRYEYSPEGGNAGSWDSRGSETGFLYRTYPFVGVDSGTGLNSGIASSVIVDEILACRYRKPSKHIAGFDYATAPFGGPFRSWQQFNEFVDHLVRTELIVDSRPIFYEWTASYQITPGPLVSEWNVTDIQLRTDSKVQKRFASQAAADVLKANFNPNTHLNELNPDRPMYTHVDKSDLIVHSTEFCFVPLGRFDVESLGYVLARTSSSSGTQV
jgi:hypothetical protein